MKAGQHTLVVALVAAALIGLTTLLGNDYYLRIVFMMCVYYLCAAGMNVLVGYAGQKSLGQAGLFAAGAYAVALLSAHTELSPWISLILAGVGVSTFIYHEEPRWWLAGLAGAAVGIMWNYITSTAITWRVR